MKLLTIAEACQLLRISRATLYGLIHSGKIPFVCVGQKKGYRLRQVDLEEFIDSNRKVFHTTESRRQRKFKHLKL
jgi:excisionase family DNA binding protein